MKNPTYKQSTATLADVANKAGVSRQTAGRILGAGTHKHKPATVEKVKKVAEELGYRPNLLARSVVAGRTYSVGVLLPRTNNDSFFAQIATGIQDALTASELVPIFLHTSPDAPEREQIHRLVDRRVDGIILVPHASRVDSDYFNEIMNRNIPAVCINSPLHNIRPVDFIGTDETHGGRSAAAYLLDKGHTRFCSVTFGRYSENLGARHDGFQNAIEAAGATCTSLELPGWSLEENTDALCGFLKQPDRPTAFFCVSDLYAAQLYKAAEKTGLSIPADFSVIGFADLIIAEYMSPALTSLRQDGIEIGRKAVHMISERITGHTGPAREKRLQVTLVERDSVQAL